MATPKPSRERRQAMARPIPREAPVTSAVTSIAIARDFRMIGVGINNYIAFFISNYAGNINIMIALNLGRQMTLLAMDHGKC